MAGFACSLMNLMMHSMSNWDRIKLPSVVFASGPDIRLVPNL